MAGRAQLRSQLETSARRCADAGVRRVLVTSAQRDGTLSGPDVSLLESVLEADLPVIAAGGIATLDDLRLLRELGARAPSPGARSGSVDFTLAEALYQVK
jgi:phosphoribosylformimino-5-aminoimidazole carboxamide ribotide isomerase